MSPQSVAPEQSPSEILQFIHIDDFTPGIYANSHISTADPQSSAPLGSAHPDGTWGCAAIAGGGLGPLPGFTSHAFDDSQFPGTSTVVLRSGFIANPGSSELIIIGEADDGTSHYVKAQSVLPAGPTFNTILSATNPTTGPGFFGAPYPVWTRMTATGAGNPPPVLAFPGAVSTDANTTSGHLYVYPVLAAPTAYGVQDLNNPVVAVVGQLIAYGSRLLTLSGITYPHPGTGVVTNENIDYTNPPLSAILGNQETVLGAEEPWGYGAWGSVSVGELLLIKKVGGALIVNGDIDNLTSVIEVPGVQSVGGFVGSAAATPNGLFYCSEKRGAWVWNGGNSSQKVSQRLADDFYDSGENVLQTNNYGFFCYQWQKYVLFSNNYMLDTETGAWWILSPQLTQSVFGTAIQQVALFWYSQAFFGNQLYAAPLELRKTHNDPFWMLFDNTVPTTAWAWQSVPIIPQGSTDRVVDVREIDLLVSAPDGDTHCSFTVTLGSFSATTTQTITSTPQTIRLNVGVRGLDSIQVQLVGKNSSNKSAPLLHSIDIGYQVRAKNPAND